MKLKIGLLLLFLSFMTCGAQTLTVASYNLRMKPKETDGSKDTRLLPISFIFTISTSSELRKYFTTS